MSKLLKYITIITLLSLLSLLGLYMFRWRSSEINSKGSFCSPLQEKNKQHFSLRANQWVNFDVSLIPNSNSSCINPYFPTIHIATNAKHDGWIHIVYTNSDEPGLKQFIDYDPNFTKAPFYTYAKDFFDAPLWTYSFFSKTLSWQGHAFAVKVDHENKTIECIGGVGWGFKRHFFKIRPIALTPTLLEEKDWKKAWQLIKESLPDYESVK